jgi:hypothetical protein
LVVADSQKNTPFATTETTPESGSEGAVSLSKSIKVDAMAQHYGEVRVSTASPEPAVPAKLKPARHANKE